MSTAMQTQPSSSIVSWTQIIYALHAFSLLTGILGAATVVGAFLTGWPSIIAVILNYIKRGEARGTWVDSHFRWQIRTFWFGLLWISMCVTSSACAQKSRRDSRTSITASLAPRTCTNCMTLSPIGPAPTTRTKSSCLISARSTACEPMASVSINAS